MSWSAVFFDLATHGGKAVIDHFSAKAKPQPQQAAPAWPTLPTLPALPDLSQHLPTFPQVALPRVAVGAIGAEPPHNVSAPAPTAADSYSAEWESNQSIACAACTRRHLAAMTEAAESAAKAAAPEERRQHLAVWAGEAMVWRAFDVLPEKLARTPPEQRVAVAGAVRDVYPLLEATPTAPERVVVAWSGTGEALRFASSRQPTDTDREQVTLRMAVVEQKLAYVEGIRDQAAAPYLPAIREARHRIGREGYTVPALEQMEQQLHGCTVALTPDIGQERAAELHRATKAARDRFYAAYLGQMKQGRAPQADVAPALKGRLYQDRETRIPARYMAYLQPTDGADILGETPETRQAFHRLLTFAEGQGVTVREYPFPPDIEDGQVVALTFGAYAPDLGPKGTILLGPQVSAESPRAVETAGEEVMHSILDSNACNVWRTDQSKVAYEDQPEEQEAKLANLIALHAARVPFETSTGQRIDPRTVELDIAAMERSEDPRIVRRAKWAGAIGARVLAGESVTVGACPR